MCVVAFAATVNLFSQTRTSPPAFEVASIKPAGSGAIGLFTYPGGRIVANSLTLEMLIEEAFSIQPFQLSGGPGWIRNDRYTIEARPPASSALSSAKPSPPDNPNDEQRQLLQTLLADRFQLKVHRETKDGPVYLLVKGGKETRLQEAKDKDARPWAGGLGGGRISGDGLAGVNISMSGLAARLSEYMGRPVLDQTGLNGSFDFKYDQVSDDTHPDVAAWIITSLQAIGLKLEASRGAVETIVIDHVEKPSEN
jgi:uncharacterized protein (TIGR03435 family)